MEVKKGTNNMLRLEIEGVTAAEATEFILAGLQQRLESVRAQIDAVRQGPPPEVHPRPAKASGSATRTLSKGSTAPRGTMTPEGKAKIILAQKKRWARVRKEAKLAAKAAAQSAAVAAGAGAEVATGAEAAAGPGEVSSATELA